MLCKFVLIDVTYQKAFLLLLFFFFFSFLFFLPFLFFSFFFLSFFSFFSSPISPSHVDWFSHFPDLADPTVKIADIGCGFGGLLVALSPLFPSSAILGIEIRPKVVDIDRERIMKLRREANASSSSNSSSSSPSALVSSSDSTSSPSSSSSSSTQHCTYNNISVLQANFMQTCVNYFTKHQLEAMFILFPDPHFKRSNHRRRIINRFLLDSYAYVLKPRAKLYTITDVYDLHVWMTKCLDAHPLFRRLSEEELVNDVCVKAIHEATEEGKKVERLNGSKYPAIYERIWNEEEMQV